MKEFLKDERGQDLIEYTLLMAFIALASVAIFMSADHSMQNIWNDAGAKLTQHVDKTPAAAAVIAPTHHFVIGVWPQAILWIIAGLFLAFLIVRRPRRNSEKK